MNTTKQDNTSITFVAENVRYLLWRKHRDVRQWVPTLAVWLQCNRRRAIAILQGAVLDADECVVLAQMSGVAVGTFCTTSLLTTSGINILLENIRFLLGTLSHGDKQHLAAALRVHPTTLSKWRSSEHVPRMAHIPAFIDYFGMSAETNLAVEPIFLTGSAIALQLQRDWLQSQLAELEDTTFKLLFPLFEHLLTEEPTEKDIVRELEGDRVLADA